ncbi:hypothetical protein [Amycolatopsis australiensis]|uniref:hypothetical protein n=1 Tax=Amycolatopsis australiensis TaxID=546364 RepID=UPI0026B02590
MHHARATLAGPRENPTLALTVTVEQDGDPASTRGRINTEGLPRLRQALDLETVPVGIGFRFTTATDRRVR